MRELYTEIEIAASAENVWRQLMEFKNYPSWNPFIRSIEGEAEPGAPLKVFLKPGGGAGMTLNPKVVECLPNTKFSWFGSLMVKGLFDARHEFYSNRWPAEISSLFNARIFPGYWFPLSGL